MNFNKKSSLLIIVITLLLISIVSNYLNYKSIEVFDNIYNKDIPKNMKIYCINLNKDKKRWNTIKSISDKHNLNIIRIPAYNGNELNPNECIKQNILHTNYSLRKGQLGCALSHINLWKKIKTDNDDFALIIEDDVIFTNNFKENLYNLLNYLPETWDIIYLGGCNLLGKKYNEKLLKPTNFDYRYNLCCHAMLLNKERINNLIDIMTPIKKPIDNQLRDHFKYLEIYFVVPNMIMQNKEIRSSRRDIDGLPQSLFWKMNHSNITIV
jgi:glycosyl transferase family 25